MKHLAIFLFFLIFMSNLIEANFKQQRVSETFTFDTEKIVLEAGDRIFCIGSPDIGSSLTDLAITVSYLEV